MENSSFSFFYNYFFFFFIGHAGGDLKVVINHCLGVMTTNHEMRLGGRRDSGNADELIRQKHRLYEVFRDTLKVKKRDLKFEFRLTNLDKHFLVKKKNSRTSEASEVNSKK